MRPALFTVAPKTRQVSEWVSEIPSAEENKMPKVPHQDHVNHFFDFEGAVHKQFVPEGKTVNGEFNKEVMDRLLKRIQRVCPVELYC
jgi:hypothetical protein